MHVCFTLHGFCNVGLCGTDWHRSLPVFRGAQIRCDLPRSVIDILINIDHVDIIDTQSTCISLLLKLTSWRYWPGCTGWLQRSRSFTNKTLMLGPVYLGLGGEIEITLWYWCHIFNIKYKMLHQAGNCVSLPINCVIKCGIDGSDQMSNKISDSSGARTHFGPAPSWWLKTDFWNLERKSKLRQKTTKPISFTSG